MTMTETITWHPASEPPTHTACVLICTDIGADHRAVEEGSFSNAQWYDGDSYPIDAPNFWAELPRGPQV